MALTLGGTVTLFQLSELALSHKLKLLVPPSIIIGFGATPRFMHTDNVTGYLKVTLQPGINSEKI